jgi:hypothetical protein
MNQKYDLFKAVGPGLRALVPTSPPPIELQALLLRLATMEAERSHYCGGRNELAREVGLGNRA